MVILLAAFSAGNIILYCSGLLLPWFYYFFIIVLLLLASVSFSFKLRKYLLPLVCFSLGAWYVNSTAQTYLNSVLPAQWELKDIEVLGYACSLPVHREVYSQIEFCALSMTTELGGETQKMLGKRRIKLYWSNRDIEWAQTQHKLTVRLKRPRATVNPSAASFEKYLFYSGITATGSIKASQVVEAELPLVYRFESWLTRARIKLRQALQAQLSDLTHAGLINALVLGDKSDITSLDGDILKSSGTKHLLAISGLHVGMVMFLLFKLLPSNRYTLFIVIGIGAFYVLLVGFGPSAQRAWVMCSLALLVFKGVLPRRPDLFFFLAMALVLLLDPLSVLNMGFWYSFGAVAVLLLLGILKLLSASAASLVLTQCLLLLALSPLHVSFFMPQGWHQVLANLVAIPWVSVVILPGALVSSLIGLVSSSFSQLGFGVVNEVLYFLMTFLSSLPSEGEIRPTMYFPELCAYLLVVLFLFYLLRLSLLRWCLLFTLVVYLLAPKKSSYPESELWVLDVGQGLSIFAQHKGHTWVYDLGPEYERFSSFKSVLLPFVSAGDYHLPLNGVVVSHGDNDHTGDISDALAWLAPEVVWAGEPERSALPEHTRCQAGDDWQGDGISLEVLFPPKHSLSPSYYQKASSNNRSCIVKLTVGATSFLIMGDLEGEAERELLRVPGINLTADVLIAGHHGSNNATSIALLKRVKPKHVVFSAGYLNRFGHPGAKVLKRVSLFEANVWNTADHGAIRFMNKEDSGELLVQFMRNDERPFWISGPRLN